MRNSRILEFTLDDYLRTYLDALSMYGSNVLQSQESIRHTVRSATDAVKNTNHRTVQTVVDRFHNYLVDDLSNYYGSEKDFDLAYKEISSSWLNLVTELKNNLSTFIPIDNPNYVVVLISLDVNLLLVKVNVYEEITEDIW